MHANIFSLDYPSNCFEMLSADYLSIGTMPGVLHVFMFIPNNLQPLDRASEQAFDFSYSSICAPTTKHEICLFRRCNRLYGVLFRFHFGLNTHISCFVVAVQTEKYEKMNNCPDAFLSTCTSTLKVWNAGKYRTCEYHIWIYNYAPKENRFI